MRTALFGPVMIDMDDLVPPLLRPEDEAFIRAVIDLVRHPPEGSDRLKLAQTVITWLTCIRMAKGPDALPDEPYENSALLRRLLSGKEPLSYAPPTSFSQPWYAIVEDRGPHRCQTSGHISQPPAEDEDRRKTVLINECRWRVVESRGPSELVVQWMTTNLVCRLWRNPTKADDPFPWLMERIYVPGL